VGKAPVIVPVSDLRRDTARLIQKACKSHEPLFITQRGYVTAVLLSREEYDLMCVLRDKGMKALNPHVVLVERQIEEQDLGRGLEQPRFWDE
jgi:prevent-host-death family protein